MPQPPEPPLDQHNVEIEQNRRSWDRKPLLQAIYRSFYLEIARLIGEKNTRMLELGSGIGAIKMVLPQCQTSDIFPNPWLDRVENAYAISEPDHNLTGLVLFDVWHHLEYPAAALKEFARVLEPGGRLVIFDPAMGALGRLVYGVFHHEPLGFGRRIDWSKPASIPLNYYAAQGNAWRMFIKGELPAEALEDFRIAQVKVYSALGYVASGGFSKPQLYPSGLYPLVRRLQSIADRMPKLFGTRIIVCLERR